MSFSGFCRHLALLPAAAFTSRSDRPKIQGSSVDAIGKNGRCRWPLPPSLPVNPSMAELSHQRRRADTRSRGVTLIEAAVTIAVVAMAMAFAVPSFDRALSRNRLRGATDVLVADLQLARSEAIRTNQNAVVNFGAGSNWCYGITLGTSSCDCSVAGSCSVKQVLSSDHPRVSLSSSFTVDPAFDARRGLASASGTVTLTGGNGEELRVSLSLLGLLSVCSPAGAGHVSGYRTC